MTRRRILIALGVLVVVIGAGVAFVLTHSPGNVSNPDVQFSEDTPTATPKPGRKAPGFSWPMYGFTPDRRRVVDVPPALVRPPFKQLWTYHGHNLLEFPPVMSPKSLFVLRDDAVVASIDKATGKTRWARHVGALSASAPALDIPNERLYLTVLSRTEGGPGRVLAMSTAQGSHGSVVWSRDLDARTESSPLLDQGRVFFGDEGGTVYALDADTGKTVWTFQAAGPVKSALALHDGKLFFGDYAGKAYAISEKTGKLAWEAKTQGAQFGFASGRFYGNPVVANGRVFIGNVDGYVYSFAESTGELAWRTKTNGYVYASPTVGTPQGGKPTVYIGSYDGTFYALDARSGAIRWHYTTGGHISGGSTMLGNTIWFSDLVKKHSYALDARTGKKLYEYPGGGYATLITDRKVLYLVGYLNIYALRPRA